MQEEEIRAREAAAAREVEAHAEKELNLSALNEGGHLSVEELTELLDI